MTMPGHRSTSSTDEVKQGAETPPASRNWTWVEAEVWTERMLSALATASKAASFAVFANVGLVALHTARQTARQSR
jgi:hypothetical protein